MKYKSNRTGRVRERKFVGLSGLKVQWQGKQLDEAVRLARKGHHLDAAETFDRSGALPEQQAKHADDLAYVFYRRASSRKAQARRLRSSTRRSRSNSKCRHRRSNCAAGFCSGSA